MELAGKVVYGQLSNQSALGQDQCVEWSSIAGDSEVLYSKAGLCPAVDISRRVDGLQIPGTVGIVVHAIPVGRPCCNLQEQTGKNVELTSNGGKIVVKL